MPNYRVIAPVMEDVEASVIFFALAADIAEHGISGSKWLVAQVQPATAVGMLNMDALYNPDKQMLFIQLQRRAAMGGAEAFNLEELLFVHCETHEAAMEKALEIWEQYHG